MSGAENPVESNLQNNPNGGVSREVSTRSPSSVEKAQPKPLCALLPPSVMETRTVYEVNKTIPSMRRSKGSLKTTSVHTEPDEEGKDTKLLRLTAFVFFVKLTCLFSFSPSVLRETSVLQSFWHVSSVTHWTACWPPWGDVASASGHCAPTCAAASPPPCSPSWTSPTTVTSADVSVLAVSCATVPSATSASRLPSAWTSPWRSLKCSSTDTVLEPIITTSRHMKQWESFIC